MARARVTDIALQRRLQHASSARHVRLVDGKSARPRQQQEQRLRVQGRDVEIVGYARPPRGHGVGIRAILFEARGRIEALDIPDAPSPDERLLLRVRCASASAIAF